MLLFILNRLQDHGGQLELHDAPADFDHGHGAMIRVILPYEETVAADADKKNKEMSHGL